MGRAGILVVTAVAMSAAVFFLGALGVPAATYERGDFLQFWLQPQALWQGASPYDPAWWAAMHAKLGVPPLFPEAVYPPHDALVFLPLALLPLSAAAAAWLVVQLAAVGWVCGYLARPIAERGVRMVYFALVISFQPLWLLVAGGNVTGLLLGVVGLAYLAAREGRIGRCGALLGILIVKPHPFLFLVPAVLLTIAPSQRRAFLLGLVATAGPLVAVTLILRPGWYAEWLPAAIGLQTAPGSNATAWTIGRVLGVASALPGAIAVAGSVLLFLVWAWRVRPSLASTIAAAIPISLAVAPHGWSYDQLLLLVPLAACSAAIAVRPASERRRELAVVTVLAVAIPWALYALAFRRGGEELSILTPLLVFAAYWYLRADRHPLRIERSSRPILR